MEGDASSACLMISEYKYIQDFLAQQQASTAEPALQFMLVRMLVKVNTYLNKAIKCDAIVLATVFSPCYQLSMFQLWFPNHYRSAERLLREVYNQRKLDLDDNRSLPKSSTPVDNQSGTNNRRPNIPRVNFFPSADKTPAVDKLTIYLEGKYILPDGEEDQCLLWWKVSCLFSLC